MERFPLPLSHSLASQTNFLSPRNKNQASTPIFLFWVPPTLPQNLAFPFQQSSSLIFQCMGEQRGLEFLSSFMELGAGSFSGPCLQEILCDHGDINGGGEHSCSSYDC